MKKALLNYKNLSISKEELKDIVGGDLYNTDCKTPEVIKASDVINALEAFGTGKISKEKLLDWVNVVWFTDLYEFCEDELESIVSVLQVLETLDEENTALRNHTRGLHFYPSFVTVNILPSPLLRRST